MRSTAQWCLPSSAFTIIWLSCSGKCMVNLCNYCLYLSHWSHHVILIFCSLSASSQGLSRLFGLAAEMLELHFNLVISRQEIKAIAFAQDYEKCFFPRQAMAFCFKKIHSYPLCLSDGCLEFQAESQVMGWCYLCLDYKCVWGIYFGMLQKADLLCESLCAFFIVCKCAWRPELHVRNG